MGTLERHILTADVVYNGLGTPRAGGAVVVQTDGVNEQIALVDSLQQAQQRYPEAQLEEAGFAVSPAPVNAHTHLDLSRLPLFSGDYQDFIRHVIAHRDQRGLEAARAGVAQLRTAGTHIVGDIVARQDVMEFLLQEADLRGVAYWEVIGPNPQDADRIFDETVETLRHFRSLERPGGMRVGLSPHTPHTVSAPLLQKLAGLAMRSGLPMQIHVAESPQELDFHKDGSGFPGLRELLGSWQPSGLTPVGYLKSLGVLEAQPALVHMIHVTEDDVRDVQRAGCVVVHCPRSNHALGCGRFPWELYMKHGVEVALGTDSRGSSPSLSIEEEVLAAARQHGPKASPLALVRAAVKGGHRALGMTPPRFVRGDPATKVHVWRAE
ncbi:MAG TPA: amidohydrolase family protein [Trueperaceae bacterium]